MILDEEIKNSINWLLNSNIRIKHGKAKGALYGWKDLTTSSYPFIYSEIVGYAITCFSWLYRNFLLNEALKAAQESSKWVGNNILSGLLITGKLNKSNSFDLKGDISNQIYSFDNAMILSGLLNLYNIDNDNKNLNTAITIGDALINNFFDGKKMIALLDRNFNQSDYGKDKWSTISGSFQSKIAMSLLKLFKVTGNSHYKDVSESLCLFALEKQNPDGRFRTNDIDSDLTFLHPHLYSCEGLLYSGINLQNYQYIDSALKGIEWAIQLMDKNNGQLPRSTKENIEQSDCMAQLLRLLIICYSELKKRNNAYDIDAHVDKLQQRILNLCIINGEEKGGVLYQKNHNQACTWCTMFTIQAFNFYKQRKMEKNYSMADMIEYYI